MFLCGAGVSIPAGLPGFVDLTRYVIDEVDPPQDSEIRRAFGRWIDKDSPVPEVLRFGLDHLFQLLNREYGRERVARIVWERLAKIDSTCTRKHDIVARISANAEGCPQVVTTNFDRLFESALAARATPIHKPPMYPDLRHGVPATGITYLHGRLADTESGPHDYILSSADLGRAYLAQGWATAFIQQLLRDHTVVLLGYRAEDPPVQYLFQGLDSIGRQTAKRSLAFDEGTRGEVEARWRDRGIEAIPYGDSHEALWETLDAWAERADNPNDPALAWWVARQPTLHPRLHRMLKRAVEDTDALDAHVRNGWAILFEALATGPPRSVDLEWLEVRRRIGKQGWTSGLIRAFEAATEPVFAVLEQSGVARAQPSPDAWSKVGWAGVADFEVHFPATKADRPNVPDDALEPVYAAIERNLMRASERLREIPTTWFPLRTFYPEEGSAPSHASKPDDYVGWFRELLNRLAELAPDRLSRHIALWPVPEPLIFDRLRLYVWNKQELFSGDEAAGEVLALSDDQFWRPEHRRELMFLLSGRWADFSAEHRDLIGRRILDGPPGPHDEEEEKAEHTVRSAMTAAERFGWLVKAGCTLSASLRSKWTALKSALPEWQDSWVDGAVATNEVRAGRVGTNEDASALDGLPIGRIVQVALERSGRSGDPFVEDRPFTGLVKNNPQRAIAALGAAARRGEFSDVLWRSVIRDWPDLAPRRATRLLHGRLSRLPCTTIDALRDAVGDWLRDGFPNAAGDDKALAYDVFDHLVGCLLAAGSAATESAVGEQTIGGEPIQWSRQTRMHAINGPIGKAVKGLLKELGDGNPAPGSALPVDLEARLNQLLAAPGEGSGHAVCVLSTYIAWLHHLDSAWVDANMIPWFHLDHHRREPAWSGILWNRWQCIQPVFGAIKNSFLALPAEMYTWASRKETEQYCCWIVAASLLAGDDGPRLSFKEARECLRRINPEGRQHAIWFLAQVGAGHDDGWQELVVPFVRKAWPNEQEYQTGETTEGWLSLLQNTRDSLPNVLAAVRDHLRPVHSGRPVLYAFDRDAGPSEPLTTRFPRETLDLLDRVAPSGSRDVPYGLADVLGLLVEAEPALIGDTRYTRLRALAAPR